MSADRQHLNALRGLGCLLLVTYHVVGADPSAGLKIESGLLRDASDLLRYIRMPLFTFLSGLVYALRPYSGDAGRFLRGKARRLLIPLLTVGTLFHLMRAATNGTHADGQQLYASLIWPHSHFWYLHALFLVFCSTLVLEALGLLARPGRLAAVFVVAAGASALEFDLPLLAIDRAVYLFPFFLAGLGVQRFHLRDGLDWKPGLLAALAVAAVLVGMALGAVPEFSRSTLQGQALGLLACIALLSFRMAPMGLPALGVYSYTVFLYHIFFTAGARIALTRAGVAAPGLLFLLASAAGLLGPVLVDRLLSRNRLTALLFLGKSPARAEARRDLAPQPATAVRPRRREFGG